MCSRYELSATATDIAVRFGLTAEPPSVNRGETRPTDEALVISAPDLAETQVWGVPTPWGPRPLINARAETLTEKKVFRRLLDNRLLIPASAYFEWRHDVHGKIPNRIVLDDNSVMAFAALSDGKHFTIITCEPAPAIAHVHDRMPVILTGQAVNSWLDPERRFADVQPLLIPLADQALVAQEDIPAQRSLFD